MKQVEQARIEFPHIAGAVIAQELVQLLDGVGKIDVALSVNNVDAFVGVSVEEPQPVFTFRSDSRLRGLESAGANTERQGKREKRPQYDSFNSQKSPGITV